MTNGAAAGIISNGAVALMEQLMEQLIEMVETITEDGMD